MTEIYKIINHIAPPIMSSLFEIRVNTYNTRYFQVLPNESRRTVNYGLETTCYRAPFLWANLPPAYELANSLNVFKRKIKNWKGEKGELAYISVSINISNIFFKYSYSRVPNNRLPRLLIFRFFPPRTSLFQPLLLFGTRE